MNLDVLPAEPVTVEDWPLFYGSSRFTSLSKPSEISA